MALGQVTVDFNANLSRFTGALDKATSDLSKFQSNSQRIGANVGKIFSGLGAGLSVAAFGGFIKASIDAADKLNDLSKSTGVSVEQLAGLQLAAKQSGTDLEGVALSINKLSVNIGRDGEKFAKLGITAKEPLEAFKQLADVLVAIKDPQERAAVSAEALGKGWASAAPLLAEGGKAIGEIVDKGSKAAGITKEMTEQAAAFNDSLDELKLSSAAMGTNMAKILLPGLTEVSKAMTEAAKEGSLLTAVWVGLGGLGAALFTDEFTSAQTKLAKLRSELASFNETSRGFGETSRGSPIFSGSGDAHRVAVLKEQIKAQEKLIAESDALAAKAPKKTPAEKPVEDKKIKDFLGSKGASGTDKRLEFIKALRREVELLGATDGDKRLFDADRLGITGKALGEVRSLSARLNEYKQSLEAAKIANQDFDESFADNEKHIEAIESLIGAFRKQNEQITAEADLIGATNVERETAVRLRELELVGLSKYSAEWEKAGEAIKKASESSRLGSLLADIPEVKTKQILEDVKLIDDAFFAGKISVAEWGQAIEKSTGGVDNLKDKVSELDDFAKNAAKNIQDAFADFLFDPFKGGLDGMLQGFGQTIKRIVAEAVAADLAKRLFGDLTKGGEGEGLLGAGLKLFSGLFAPSAKGNVFNSPGLSAYSGQIISKPTVFPFASGVGLMGEAGPEAILPLQRGADGKLGVAGGASGGSTINVYVSGSNNAPDVRRAAGQGAREALAALAGAQRYG